MDTFDTMILRPSISFTSSGGVGDFSVSFCDFIPPARSSITADFAGLSFSIVRDPKICGGAPVIKGTRISVHHLIEQMIKLHWPKERLVQSYPHLSIEQVESALNYYESHKAEIEKLIEREESAD